MEGLLDRSQGNRLRTLSADELDALGRGYREVAGDLAIARRDFPGDALTAALNGLASRAHLRLYRGPAASWWSLLRFFAIEFPRRFRSAGRLVLLAAALFFLPAAFGLVAAQVSDEVRRALVPAELLGILESGRTWTDFQPRIRPLIAAVVLTNNIQVSFLAFAGGALLGLGSAYVLAANGLSIGATLGAAHHYGVGPLLWDFVAAHGFLEITCILIAGSGGLMLGQAELLPGLQRRRDALARGARQAVALVVGAAPVFVVAGLIEGFVSPSGVPSIFKFAVGISVGVLLWGWLLTVGRLPRRRGRRNHNHPSGLRERSTL